MRLERARAMIVGYLLVAVVVATAATIVILTVKAVVP